MTCKDCIHYEVCQYKYNIMSKLKNDDVQKYCLNFKDKSKFIEMPCEVGDITISKNKNEQIELTSKYFDFRV